MEIAIYMFWMFIFGIATGFFWARYVQYGKITDGWKELKKEYEHLQKEYK